MSLELHGSNDRKSLGVVIQLQIPNTIHKRSLVWRTGPSFLPDSQEVVLWAPRDVEEGGSFRLQESVRLHLPVEPFGKPGFEEKDIAQGLEWSGL